MTKSAEGGAFTRAAAACMVVQGRTLFETLLLNCHGLWPDAPGPGQRGTGDRPTWERVAPPDPRDRDVTGHLDLLTRRPRRIHLWHHLDDGGRAVVDGAAVLKGEVIPEASWQAWQAHETMAAFRALTDEERKDKTKMGVTSKIIATQCRTPRQRLPVIVPVYPGLCRVLPVARLTLHDPLAVQ